MVAMLSADRQRGSRRGSSRWATIGEEAYRRLLPELPVFLAEADDKRATYVGGIAEALGRGVSSAPHWKRLAETPPWPLPQRWRSPATDSAQTPNNFHKIVQNRLALLGKESVSVGHRRHPLSGKSGDPTHAYLYHWQ